MEWFGPTWNAPVNRDCEEVPVPGFPCLVCGKDFSKDDQGIVTPFMGDPEGRGKAAYHVRCFAESVGITEKQAVRDA